MQDILIIIILAIIAAAWITHIITTRKRDKITRKHDKDLRRKINTIIEFQKMQLDPELLKELEDMEKQERRIGSRH